MMVEVAIQIVLLLVLLVGGKSRGIGEDYLSRNNTDTIRYLCCFVVLFSHLPFGNYLYLKYLHFVAVTLFFILSGYGLTSALIRDRDKFIKRQPYRLMKLLLYILPVLGIEYLLKFPVGNAGLWWFNVLILFYSAYGLIVYTIRDMRASSLVMCFFVFFYSLFSQIVIKSNYLGSTQQSTGFAIGILCTYYKESIETFIKRYWKILIPLSTVIAIWAGVEYVKPHDIEVVTNRQYLLRFIISYYVILVIFCILIHFSFGNKVIIFFGGVSGWIYAIQGIIISMISMIEGISEESNIVLIIGFTVIIASAIFNIEKILKNLTNNLVR